MSDIFVSEILHADLEQVVYQRQIVELGVENLAILRVDGLVPLQWKEIVRRQDLLRFPWHREDCERDLEVDALKYMLENKVMNVLHLLVTRVYRNYLVEV